MLEDKAVLLVDDDITLLEMYVERVKAEGAIVLQAKDGEEALEFIFGTGRYEGRDVESTPKVILLDLKMPKISGIEVLKEIRKDERTRKIPVVVLTSSNEEKDIVDAYELGVNSYIVKPIDFQKFSNSIKDIGYYWLVLNNTVQK